MELILWYIAKFLPLPTVARPGVPAQVSHIVLKLLAKTAEERCQNASGLQADLHQWASRGEILSFPRRQQDVSDRFIIPQYLAQSYEKTR